MPKIQSYIFQVLHIYDTFWAPRTYAIISLKQTAIYFLQWKQLLQGTLFFLPLFYEDDLGVISKQFQNCFVFYQSSNIILYAGVLPSLAWSALKDWPIQEILTGEYGYALGNRIIKMKKDKFCPFILHFELEIMNLQCEYSQGYLTT